MLSDKGSSNGLQALPLILARNWGSDRMGTRQNLCVLLLVDHLSVVVVFSMPGKDFLAILCICNYLLQSLHQAISGMPTFANHTSYLCIF